MKRLYLLFFLGVMIIGPDTRAADPRADKKNVSLWYDAFSKKDPALLDRVCYSPFAVAEAKLCVVDNTGVSDNQYPEGPGMQSHGQWDLRTVDRNSPRVFGMDDSDLRGAPAIHPQNLDGPLQSVAPSYVPWPGVPDPPAKAVPFQTQPSRHRIREGVVVLARSVLGGLHHDYSLARAVV
jgi:hypothetical protein